MPPTFFKGKIKLILLLCVIFMSALYFPIGEYYVTGDCYDNLLNALKLYQGEVYDYGLTLKGPVFPGLIAMAYHLLGVNEFAGMMVVRLFFSLNFVLVFLLVAYLYDYWAGFLCAVVLIFCEPIYQGSSFLLYDTLHPFMMLSFLLMVIYGLNEHQKWLLVACGIWLGVWFSIRQDALIFYWFPWILWGIQKQWRTSKVFFMLLGYTMAAVFAVGVFLIWVSSLGEKSIMIFGTVFVKGVGVENPSQNYFWVTLISLLKNNIASALFYLKFIYHQGGLLYAVLTCLLCPAFLIWFLYRILIVKDQGSMILAVVLALHYPLFVFSAQAFRLGRVVSLIIFGGIALTCMLYYTIGQIHSYFYNQRGKIGRLYFFQHPSKMPLVAALFLIVCLIEFRAGDFSQHPTVMTWLRQPEKCFLLMPEGGAPLQEAISWARQNLPPESSLGAIGQGTTVAFRLGDRFQITRYGRWVQAGDFITEVKRADYISITFNQIEHSDMLEAMTIARLVYQNNYVRIFKIEG